MLADTRLQVITDQLHDGREIEAGLKVKGGRMHARAARRGHFRQRGAEDRGRISAARAGVAGVLKDWRDDMPRPVP